MTEVNNLTEPTVSIGVTSYQRPECLQKVLVGISNQTYRNLEILVSDDYSCMPEIDAILENFTQDDRRIRVYRQKAKIGARGNRDFVARKSTGEFFLWLNEDTHIPAEYVESCVARFADSPQIKLVGTRADLFWEGRYFSTCRNYSNLGQSVFLRLGNLITIGFYEPNAFQHYAYGVFRRGALLDCIDENRKHHPMENFSLFFRLSEQGFIHFAENVTLEKHEFSADTRKRREGKYIHRPREPRVTDTSVERLTPLALDIWRTLAKSKNLACLQKLRLWLWCVAQFTIASGALQNLTWRRVLLLPVRLLRVLLSFFLRTLERVLRAL